MNGQIQEDYKEPTRAEAQQAFQELQSELVVGSLGPKTSNAWYVYVIVSALVQSLHMICD